MTTNNTFVLRVRNVFQMTDINVPKSLISMLALGGSILERFVESTGLEVNDESDNNKTILSIKKDSNHVAMIPEIDPLGFVTDVKLTILEDGEEYGEQCDFIVVRDGKAFNISREVVAILTLMGNTQLSENNLNEVGKLLELNDFVVLKEWHSDHGDDRFVFRFEEVVEGSYRCADLVGRNIRPNPYQHQQQKVLVNGPLTNETIEVIPPTHYQDTFNYLERVVPEVYNCNHISIVEYQNSLKITGLH